MHGCGLGEVTTAAYFFFLSYKYVYGVETQIVMMIWLQKTKNNDHSRQWHSNEKGWHHHVRTSIIITPQEVSKMLWLEHINTLSYDTTLATS